MKGLRLGQLMNHFILGAVVNQLATNGGRKVALVLEPDLTAVAGPEGLCTACRQCYDADDVFRLPLPPAEVRQSADRSTPTAATCPAGLAFLIEPLNVGPQLFGYLAVGHVADVKALEERLFSLAQQQDEKPASLARRFWDTIKPDLVNWEGFGQQLHEAAAPVVTLAAAAWQEAIHTTSRPPEGLEDLYLLPRDAPDVLQAALRRACLSCDADAGILILPESRDPSLPESVPFNLSPSVAIRLARTRADLVHALNRQQEMSVASLQDDPLLGASGLVEDGMRSAVFTRPATLGDAAPLLAVFYRKPRRGRQDDLLRARDWSRSVSLLYLATNARQVADFLDLVVHAFGELVDAAAAGEVQECCQVLARWAARLADAAAFVFVANERQEPRLLAQASADTGAGRALGLSRWLARQALARKMTVASFSADGNLISEVMEETPSGQATAYPLGVATRVRAVLVTAWTRAATGRAATQGKRSEVMAALARAAGVIVDALAQRQEMAEAHAQAVQLLVTALEARFPWLNGHMRRTALLARAMALAMGLQLQEAEKVYEAAMLHDVGHLAEDAGFLDKATPLTGRERKALEAHVIQGARLLERNPLLRRLAPVVRHHRERWDGSGYPDGLRGHKIPLGARILAVAEAFDAMVSERPHRAALGLREALAEMAAGSGRQFDPECVQALLVALKSEEARNAYAALFQEAPPPTSA